MRTDLVIFAAHSNQTNEDISKSDACRKKKIYFIIPIGQFLASGRVDSVERDAAVGHLEILRSLPHLEEQSGDASLTAGRAPFGLGADRRKIGP